jgi:SAM-dependent methyltransferase
MKEVFAQIYEGNFWKDTESRSGRGSNLEQTETIRKVLPALFEELAIKTLLDIPCGDFYWFNLMWADLPKGLAYLGADIVPELIAKNLQGYSSDRIFFDELDALADWIPCADLILCRDMLGHFSNIDVNRTIKNFRASGSKYLLATTFPGRNPNQEIETGQWRAIDLEALRYGLGPAKLLINENCTESNGRFNDKSLGLWELR